MISFDIHGEFSFGVCGKQNKAIENYLDKELGYFKSGVISPDLEIELVDRIPEGQSLLPFYGRNDDLFYISDPYGHKVSLPYRMLEGKVVAEKEIDANFLLQLIIEPLMFFHLLRKGYAFLHASAVSKGDATLIFAASQDTGKTSFALSMLFRGYSFLGNEWSLISEKGLTYPYPRPILLGPHNFQAFPELPRRIAINHFGRRKIRGEILISKVRSKMKLGHSTHLILRAANLALQQANKIYEIDAKQFGDIGNVSQIKRIFILERNIQATEVNLTKIEDKEGVATRLAANFLWERDTFNKHYLAYLFAFPGGRNPIVEDALKIHREIVKQALKDTLCFRVTLSENMPFKKNFEEFWRLSDLASI